MTKIIESAQNIELFLSTAEKIASLHGNLVASKSDLISRKVFEKPFRSGLLKGVRAPGTGIPLYSPWHHEIQGWKRFHHDLWQ